MAIPWNAVVNVGGQAMSWLSNLFGSSSSSNAMQSLNRADTKWMYNQQSKQWRANTEWYNQNGYSLLRQGLEDAGYNPLMALGAQPLDGATVSGSAMDSKQKSFSIDLPQALAQTMANIKNTNADTMLKNAQTEENISRSNLQITQNILSNKEIPYRERQIAAQTLGLELENRYKGELVKSVRAETGLKVTQADLSRVQQSYYYALSNSTNAERKHMEKLVEKLQNDIDLTSAEKNWITNHPRQAAFLQFVTRYGSAVGSIIGSGATGTNAYSNLVKSRK